MLIEVPIKLAFKMKNSETGIFGKIISFVTRSKYYHVEIIIDKLWVGADAPMGVTMNTLEPLRYDHWEYVDLGIMVLSKTSYDELLNYIESLKGIEYDYLAIIFSQLLPYSLHSKDKLFCSEVVTILLQILHYEQVKGLKPHEVSPKDLARLFGLKG